ncbi:MAG: hypothetical protein FWB98_00995 [Defluviitaleaceae bacterium]|nr:hypothetical protein [Defluviitaleaceae bacterium]
MRKFVLPALLLVFGLAIFTGCGDRPVPVTADNPLIGTWDWPGLPGFYVFNADGTGNRGNGMDHFDWWTDGNLLAMNMTSGVTRDTRGVINNERWDFTLTDNGNTLRIDSRQERGMNFTYTRAN